MKRKEFIRLAAPAFFLLANGRIFKSANHFLPNDHWKKVKLRFAVASDGHYGQAGTDFQSYFSTLVTRINEEHARHPFSFCVVNGDIVHDDKSHYPAAKKAFDAFHPKYYVSQGNHDHVTAAEWEAIWNMPVNFDFSIEKNTFLVGTTSNEQGTYLCPDINWFRQQLEAHQGQDIFIFIHINPVKLTKYGVDCTELMELFARHKNIRAVFNGHDHDEEGIKVKNGLPYVFDSHFGGDWGTSYRGFRVVEVMKDNSIVTYIMDPVKELNKASLGS